MKENNTNIDSGKEEKVNKKALIIMVVLIFLLVILVVGSSYQVYLYTTTGKSIINEILGRDSNIFNNGTVTIVYTEGENSVKIENAIPMTDEAGMKMSDPSQLMDFTVSININKSSNVSYEIVAEKDQTSTIDNKYIKIYLQRSINAPTYEEEIIMPTKYTPIEEEDDYGVPSGNMVIDQVSVSSSITYYYRLRMWLDSSYPLDNTYKFFRIKINVYGKGERIKNNNTTNNSTTNNNNNGSTTNNNNSTENNNTSDNNSTENKNQNTEETEDNVEDKDNSTSTPAVDTDDKTEPVSSY